MKIINSMFAKGLGGIEQAFVDYTEALLLHGWNVVCVVSRGAKIVNELKNLRTEEQKNSQIPKFSSSQVEIIEVSQLGKWDVFAKFKLSKLVKEINPKAVIAHGNRPSSLLRFGCKQNKVKLISVAHNYKIKPLLKSDHIFSITTDLKNYIGGSRYPLSKISVIPNMLKFSHLSSVVSRQQVPTIGVMARFVKKKGIDIFIKACGALKDKGYKFNAVIGGTGEEQFELQKLRDELKLNDLVKFTGWVKDKNEFYNSVDIFCLPSHHEPFGIVILEAMSHKKPIVTTDSEGPSEICESGKDCLMVEKGHAGKLAIALADLLDNPEKAKKLAEEGYNKLINNYTLEKISEQLNIAVEKVINSA